MFLFLIGAAATSAILGDWQGMSTCAIRPSACHDEQSRYEVIPSKLHRGDVELRLSKLVGNQYAYFGSVELHWDSSRNLWLGTTQDRAGSSLHWEFQPQASAMHGKLIGSDGETLRRIELHR